jgi:hypothetical protein
MNNLTEGESHITEFTSLGLNVHCYTTYTGETEIKCKGLSQNLYTDDIPCYDDTEEKYLKTGKKSNSGMLKDFLSG